MYVYGTVKIIQNKLIELQNANIEFYSLDVILEFFDLCV